MQNPVDGIESAKIPSTLAHFRCPLQPQVPSISPTIGEGKSLVQSTQRAVIHDPRQIYFFTPHGKGPTTNHVIIQKKPMININYQTILDHENKLLLQVPTWFVNDPSNCKPNLAWEGKFLKAIVQIYDARTHSLNVHFLWKLGLFLS